MPNKIQHQFVVENDAVSNLTEAAENFLHRLMQVADRYGCFHARLPMLRAALYPLRLHSVTEESISTRLTECVNAGLIKLYHINGLPYLQIAGFKRRLGAYKTPIPAPVFEEEVLAAPPSETAAQQTTMYTYNPPAPQVESQPPPGREHEHFFCELFYIRSNEKYRAMLAERVRQPEVKQSWIKAFNSYLQAEGLHYPIDHEWFAYLEKWLPDNVNRLIMEERYPATQQQPPPQVYKKQRPKPFVV